MAPGACLFVVEDDQEVLAALGRDLRRRYRPVCELIYFTSGADAIAFVASVDKKSVEVALFISDLRMPGMNGVEFLIQASRVHPRAKRLLLTAYADADHAIRAINAGGDRYIQKPWDPPETVLFPTIDFLINEWRQESDVLQTPSHLKADGEWTD